MGSVAAEDMDAKLQEALRQGERMLSVQQQVQDRAFNKAGELLRLSVATLGGLAVVLGILASIGFGIDTLAFVGLTSGVLLATTSACILAMLLAGMDRLAELAYGPNLDILLEHADDPGLAPVSYSRSIVQGFAECIHENERLLKGVQLRKSIAVLSLGVGVVLMLAALFYIMGGHMYGW